MWIKKANPSLNLQCKGNDHGKINKAIRVEDTAEPNIEPKKEQCNELARGLFNKNVLYQNF